MVKILKRTTKLKRKALCSDLFSFVQFWFVDVQFPDAFCAELVAMVTRKIFYHLPPHRSYKRLRPYKLSWLVVTSFTSKGAKTGNSEDITIECLWRNNEKSNNVAFSCVWSSFCFAVFYLFVQFLLVSRSTFFYIHCFYSVFCICSCAHSVKLTHEPRSWSRCD